jgi:hypothetical protein
METSHPAVFKHDHATVIKKPVFSYAITVDRSIYFCRLAPRGLNVAECHSDRDLMIEDQYAEVVRGTRRRAGESEQSNETDSEEKFDSFHNVHVGFLGPFVSFLF